MTSQQALNVARRGDYTADRLLKTVLVTINRAGWPFIGLFAVASLARTALAEPLGLVGIAGTAQQPETSCPTEEP